MVIIKESAFRGMMDHAEEGYPNEICGVLIGNEGEISHFKKCPNLNEQRAKDRYELDPDSFKRADDWARENGMEIIGVYHSHPDHPSSPSEFDRQRAWHGWIYIIYSINDGRYNDVRAWILDETDSFSEEEINLI